LSVYSRQGRIAEVRAETNGNVRGLIEAPGDAAVRHISVKLADWDRESYALAAQEKQSCPDQLPEQDLKDIDFAQKQLRNVPQIQRDRRTSRSRRCSASSPATRTYRAIPPAATCRGKNPLLASAHMSVITAKAAGVPCVTNGAAPFLGKPAPAAVAPHIRSSAEVGTFAKARRCGHPEGGYAGSSCAAGYTASSIARHLEASAAETVAIAQVKGIDAPLVGRVGPVVTYGPASQDDPGAVEVVERVCEAGQRHDRPIGMSLARIEDVPLWAGRGSSLFLPGSDHNVPVAGAADLIAWTR
jgi:hypothetical protein